MKPCRAAPHFRQDAGRQRGIQGTASAGLEGGWAELPRTLAENSGCWLDGKVAAVSERGRPTSLQDLTGLGDASVKAAEQECHWDFQADTGKPS